MTDLAPHYLEEMKRQFRGNKRMGEAAMAQLEDKDFFVAIDPESNSVATLVKHIAGNARSRFTDFLTSDGEKADRFRDQEFEISAKTTAKKSCAGGSRHGRTCFPRSTRSRPKTLNAR
jgi:hypothetical protein